MAAGIEQGIKIVFMPKKIVLILGNIPNTLLDRMPYNSVKQMGGSAENGST